jgi:hypothetical protein
MKLAYKLPLAMSPPERGHLSRTGHVGRAYIPRDTVLYYISHLSTCG